MSQEPDPHTREDLIQVEHSLYSLYLDEQRGKRHGTSVAADFLGVSDRSKLAMVDEDIPAPDKEAVQLVLLEQMRALDADTLTGAHPAEPLSWTTIQLGRQQQRVPNYASLPFPPGTVSASPLFVRVWPQNTGTLHVEVSARPTDHALAEAYLAELVQAARGDKSPYRHQIVEAFYGAGGVNLRLVDLERVDRGSLVLAPAVWDAVHRNVDRMFERMDRLDAAGLGTNRGLLLAGPPGTGKSALCRALAEEYTGRVTTTIVSAAAGQHLLGQLYERIDVLSPALVLIEDLDLLVGDREDRERFPLVQFLTVLDGLMTHHSRVVTIATTNDAELVDSAAVRAARFDQVVHLELPDLKDRGEILRVYLRGLEHEADIDDLARRCDRFSGADLREVVRAAVLDASDAVVHHHDLLDAVDRRREALGTTTHGPSPWL